ncbi:MAG TPA: cytochrome c family protein [Rhizomicrobium sp.]|jgi:cytochrome c|nr:cytochrome c family protein [Rhizomicrobium sp.]
MKLKQIALMAAAGLLVAGAAHAGDAKKGAAVFQRCAMCHANTKDGGNRIGPDLFGIVGRKAGTATGFYYSPAMKAAGFVWTPDKLKAYIANPQKVVPGDRMAFGGISDPAQLDDLVVYLATLK